MKFALLLVTVAACTVDVDVDKPNILPDAVVIEDASIQDAGFIPDAFQPTDASEPVPDAAIAQEDAMTN